MQRDCLRIDCAMLELWITFIVPEPWQFHFLYLQFLSWFCSCPYFHHHLGWLLFFLVFLMFVILMLFLMFGIRFFNHVLRHFHFVFLFRGFLVFFFGLLVLLSHHFWFLYLKHHIGWQLCLLLPPLWLLYFFFPSCSWILIWNLMLIDNVNWAC